MDLGWSIAEGVRANGKIYCGYPLATTSGLIDSQCAWTTALIVFAFLFYLENARGAGMEAAIGGIDIRGQVSEHILLYTSLTLMYILSLPGGCI